MRVLIVKGDPALRGKMTFLLETELKASVKEAENVQEGLGFLLDENQKFNVLICDDSTENQKLFKYLMTADLGIRCLLLKDPKAAPVLAFPDLVAGHVNPEKVTEGIKEFFAAFLNSEKPDQAVGEDANYCRIRPLVVVKEYPLASDVFIRLSALKYVKIFNKGDNHSDRDMVKFFKDKKLDYLYLTNADAAKFADNVKGSLEKEFKAASTPGAATKVAASVHETVAELGSRLGFTPEVQALAKQGMVMTLKTIGTGTPMLSQIFKSVMAEKDKYSGNHAILTAQLACSLATLMKWSSESTFQKLTFAAFFHDIAITNNNLVQINSPEELEKRKAEFTKEEITTFKAHPLIGAQTTAKFKEVPPDVDVIISQHHERPDGTGFPRKLAGEKIAPLAALFIIAHDLVHEVLQNGSAGLPAYLENYKKQYPAGRFKKILDCVDVKTLS
jgi:HD-GYP domain-containing protein (c-di-GMP phosphodiesterase class II)